MRWRLEGVTVAEVDTRIAAKILGFRQASLTNLRINSKGPEYRRLPNGRVRYSIEALETFMTEQTLKRGVKLVRQ
jgi:hypothetical protein